MIGTAAAIALAATTGAQTASSIYSTRRAGAINERAIDAQAASEAEALRLDQQRINQEAAGREQYYNFEQQRWNDYVQAHQPYWNVGQQAFNSMADLAGIPRGAAPGAGPS